MYNNHRLSLQKNFKICIDMAQSNVNMSKLTHIAAVFDEKLKDS